MRRRQRVALLALGGLGVAALALGIVLSLDAGEAAKSEAVAEVTDSDVTTAIPEPSSAIDASATPFVSVESSGTPSMVEVPSFIGRPIDEARIVADAAGLLVVIVEDPAEQSVSEESLRAVLEQDPVAGAHASTGSPITLTLPPYIGPSAASSGFVVCIDPGHQSQSDTLQEPVGPGADSTKDRVLGGTTGIATRVPEYEVTLQIAMNLKTRLEQAGVTVVMTRETNDVNVSNAERAQIANEAGADLFIRIHGDGSVDDSVSGISTLYPGENEWTGSIVGRSAQAAEAVQAALVASTGAVDRGVVPRTDITGFNWASVPAILVECGFMSNAVEDRLLTSPHYQDKLAEGMLKGILAYAGRQ